MTKKYGSPLWYDVLAPVMQSLCLLRGGHVSAGEGAPMLCSRCGWWGGDLYKTTHKKIWQQRGSVYWLQVNRYRDWIAPWGLRHPRLAAVFRILVCPDCTDIRSVRYRKDGCDSCAFAKIQNEYTPRRRRKFSVLRGQMSPESQARVQAKLDELNATYEEALKDPEFVKELEADQKLWDVTTGDGLDEQ